MSSAADARRKRRSWLQEISFKSGILLVQETHGSDSEARTFLPELAKGTRFACSRHTRDAAGRVSVSVRKSDFPRESVSDHKILQQGQANRMQNPRCELVTDGDKRAQL